MIKFAVLLECYVNYNNDGKMFTPLTSGFSNSLIELDVRIVKTDLGLHPVS